jgi:hypothetical protein
VLRVWCVFLILFVVCGLLGVLWCLWFLCCDVFVGFL